LGRAISTLLLYLVFGAGYVFSLNIYVYVFSAVVIWLLGHFLFEWIYRNFNKNQGLPAGKRYSYRFNHLDKFLIFCTCAGMLAPLSFIAHAGINVSQIVDVRSLLSTAQSTHALMSENQIETDFVSKICLMLALSGIMMAGLYLGLGRPGRPLPNYILYSPITPYFVMMMLTTMRSLMVLALLVLFASFIASLALRGRDRAIFKSTLFLKVVSGVIGLFVMIVLMQAVRAGDYKFERLGDSLEHLRLWFAGYLPAFTSWSLTVWDGSHKMGASTFRLFASALGLQVDQMQYGGGMVSVGNGQVGNATTCLSFFVSDFGMKGALIFVFAWGCLNGWVSEAARRGKVILAPALSLLLATAIWAPNSWFLGYGARILSPVVITLYLYFFASTTVVDLRSRRRSRRPGEEGEQTDAFSPLVVQPQA
jgi:oligosaccharide repeat unit polymerase